MASKRIEELLQNASEKDKAGIKDSIEKLSAQRTQIEKDPRYEKPPETHTKPEGPNTKAPEPLHKETPWSESQRGADKIKQHMPDQAKSEALEQGRILSKNGVTMAKEPERER